MSDERAYRIQLQYVPEKQVFVARVQELDLTVEAETRAEALENIESQIDSTVEKSAVEGQKLPRPVDISDETGSLSLELSAPVWRDLLYHARAQKLEPEALALQLLTRAIGQLYGRPGSRKAKEPVAQPEAASAEETQAESAETEKQAPRRNNNRRGRGRGGRREGYRPDMEDQANFLAYVRDQEKGGRGRR